MFAKQASTHRRSHEGGGGGYDYSPRYSSYEEKGYDRYRDERERRSYREHHSGDRERYSPHGDEYMHYRKEHKDVDRHEMSRSAMPPPPPPSMSRHSASPRRSSSRGRGGLERGGRGLRSRPSMLRGSSRGSRTSMSLRKADGVSAIKRKSLMDVSYGIKKKIMTSRANLEALRKMRLQKIRR